MNEEMAAALNALVEAANKFRGVPMAVVIAVVPVGGGEPDVFSNMEKQHVVPFLRFLADNSERAIGVDLPGSALQ